MIKNRARETVQVRQGAVRSSKRNEKLAAKRGVNLSAVSTPMQIEQQVQTEMNVRAVRRARQVVQQQQQQTTMMTGTANTTAARGRRKKKPAATTNNVEQVKVMRQIKQEGKKAAQQLGQSQKIKNATTTAPAAVVVPRKAIQAARNALKDSGVTIPRGYTLQLVPPSAQQKQQPPTKPKQQQQQQQQQQQKPIQQPTAQTKNRRRRPANK
jgi:hypothetical protein